MRVQNRSMSNNWPRGRSERPKDQGATTDQGEAQRGQKIKEQQLTKGKIRETKRPSSNNWLRGRSGETKEQSYVWKNQEANGMTTKTKKTTRWQERPRDQRVDKEYQEANEGDKKYQEANEGDKKDQETYGMTRTIKKPTGCQKRPREHSGIGRQKRLRLRPNCQKTI